MKKTLEEMLTYRRAHDSAGEAEFITRFIAPVADCAITDDQGTVHAYVKNIPRSDGSSAPFAFCAHTDSVHNRQIKETRQTVGYDSIRKEYFVNAKGQRDCLGADNAAGCYVLLQMIESGAPGLYVFFRGEERGGIGSEYVAKYRPELFQRITSAIQFDRRGAGSVITHMFMGRTCSDAFADSLARALGMGHKRDDTGSFTDTANLAGLVPECTNVSVGYDNEHGPREVLHWPYLQRLVARLCVVFAGNGPDLETARSPGEYSDAPGMVDGWPELFEYSDDDIGDAVWDGDVQLLSDLLTDARDCLHVLALSGEVPPKADDIAGATRAGAVPGFAGQWVPGSRCAKLAPIMRALLDGEKISHKDRALLAGLCDDIEQGAAEVPA